MLHLLNNTCTLTASVFVALMSEANHFSLDIWYFLFKTALLARPVLTACIFLYQKVV